MGHAQESNTKSRGLYTLRMCTDHLIVFAHPNENVLTPFPWLQTNNGTPVAPCHITGALCSHPAQPTPPTKHNAKLAQMTSCVVWALVCFFIPRLLFLLTN
jgi:hypothetical protein